MKKMIMILVSALVLISCNNNPQQDSSAATEETTKAQYVEVVLDVDGMTCDGCEKAIEAGLNQVEGIAEVESSHEEGWTRVKFDQALTSVEDIQSSITETGYVVEGEKTRVNL